VLSFDWIRICRVMHVTEVKGDSTEDQCSANCVQNDSWMFSKRSGQDFESMRAESCECDYESVLN
jgi:hypothetical protein